MAEESAIPAGTDPVGFKSLPFDVAESIADALNDAEEQERWAEWMVSSGLVDAHVIAGNGPEALDELSKAVFRAVEAGWTVPTTWDGLVAAGPVPLWCRIVPGYEGFIGYGGCWVVAGLLALATRWTGRVWGSEWRLPEDYGGERSEPVLSIVGGRGMLVTQFTSCVYGVVDVDRDGWLSDGLVRELILAHGPANSVEGTVDGPLDDAGGDADDEAGPEGPDIAWKDVGSYGIGFSDLQAFEEDERIDRFVEVLSAEDWVSRVYREDRELVIIETGSSSEFVGDSIRAAWERASV